jgi:hypothetical protein
LIQEQKDSPKPQNCKVLYRKNHSTVSKAFSKSRRTSRPSISQRQGIITCIPKEGKSKYSLKNWRPITLLNVDLKICSAAISNRLKPVYTEKTILLYQKLFQNLGEPADQECPLLPFFL